MKSLGLAWREVTDRDTPTFLQLLEEPITRVDVDEPTGFVAVHVEGDTHRVLGLRREAIAPLVTTLTGRPRSEVRALIAAGPAKIDAVAKPEKTTRRKARPIEDMEEDSSPAVPDEDRSEGEAP
jgi:hypothetical protein